MFKIKITQNLTNSLISTLLIFSTILTLIQLFFNQPLEVEAAAGDVFITGRSKSTFSPFYLKDDDLSGLTDIIKIDFSITLSNEALIALTSDGKVYVWGNNAFKGDGTSDKAGNTAVQVTTFTNAVDVFATTKVFGVVKSDGTVWTWGVSTDGDLGLGATTSALSPTQISGLSNITKAAAGNGYVIALNSGGTISAWGRNNQGQLGRGNTNASTTPVSISGLTGVVSVDTTSPDSGSESSFAVTSSGAVYAWGRNNVGQLGQNNTTRRTSPTLIPTNTLSNVSKISAGRDFVSAVTTSGDLYAWGRSLYTFNGNSGTIGLGTSSGDVLVPTQVSGISNVADVSSGNNNTTIVKTDGTVLSTGYDKYGSFANGSPDNVFGTYQTIDTVTNPQKLFNFGDTAYITTNSNTNITAQYPDQEGMIIATSTTGIYKPFPNTSGFTKIDAYEDYHIALKDDNTIWTWASVGSPTQVTGISGEISSVHAGYLGTFYAIKSDGTIWSWGDDRSGNLGLGASNVGNFVATPTQISGLTNMKDVVSQSGMAAATSNSGQLYVWGDTTYNDFELVLSNYPSECDISDEFDKFCFSPVAHPSFTNNASRAIAEIGDESGDVKSGILVLKSDGTVTSIGNLYTGFDFSSLSGITDIRLIISSDYRSDYTPIVIALKDDGIVYSFGNNTQNTLGRTTTNTIDNTPQPIPGLTGISKIGLGNNLGVTFAAARTSQGQVYAWGDGAYMTGKRYGSPTPIIVSGLPSTLDMTSNPGGVIVGTPTTSICQGGTAGGSTGPNITVLCLTLNPGVLSSFAADSTDNNDVCTNADNTSNTVIDTTTSNQSATYVTCQPSESAMNLSPLFVASTRQLSTSTMQDIVIDDLRGLALTRYTITATVSDFTAGSNTITLGSNPDAAPSDSHPDAPIGANNNQIFAVVDCSSSQITPIRSGTTISEGIENYERGSSTTVTSTTQEIDIIRSNGDVRPGRIDIDGCTFKLRIPAYVRVGEYTGTITQTIV